MAAFSQDQSPVLPSIGGTEAMVEFEDAARDPESFIGDWPCVRGGWGPQEAAEWREACLAPGGPSHEWLARLDKECRFKMQLVQHVA